jgi:hypothetical protein
MKRLPSGLCATLACLVVMATGCSHDGRILAAPDREHLEVALDSPSLSPGCRVEVVQRRCRLARGRYSLACGDEVVEQGRIQSVAAGAAEATLIRTTGTKALAGDERVVVRCCPDSQRVPASSPGTPDGRTP